MPNTRKKIIKTVYEDEDDSEAEKAAGDFSDSGSDAQISEHSSTEEDEMPFDASSGDDFDEKSKKKTPKTKRVKKTKFAKKFITNINKQTNITSENDQVDVMPILFSVKDLSDSDKLLPPVLNLSDSDSSDDDTPKVSTKKNNDLVAVNFGLNDCDSESENKIEYKDVWSNNIEDNSEEIAKKTFMELEQQKSKIEETKASILKYSGKSEIGEMSDVNDLLAQGEEVLPQTTSNKKVRKNRKGRDDSDSDNEDWEEVKEAKPIPQQGLQLIVDIPDAACRKSKKIDVEMMMKRKINRVKKEHQIYMHKVHVLSWIGHGNYVSCVLNDQEILAATLTLVPSKECYPGERVDMKYVEQITTWFKDKFNLKQDKNEDKFRPKAPPLKEILLGQIKTRIVTTKKYLVFIFASMLRALGLQCRIMFNFTTLPIKPPSSELCSLSTKPKEDKADDKEDKDKANVKKKVKTSKPKGKGKISQVDGNDDNCSSSEFEYENILQLDGNNDTLITKTRSTRSVRANKNLATDTAHENEDVSPPKRARKSLSPKSVNTEPKLVQNHNSQMALPQKRKRTLKKNQTESESEISADSQSKSIGKPPPSKASRNHRQTVSKDSNEVDVKTDRKSTPSLNLSKSKNKTDKYSKSINDVAETKSQKNKNCSESNRNDKNKNNIPKIVITNEKDHTSTSKYFENKTTSEPKNLNLNRRRSQTTKATTSRSTKEVEKQETNNPKSRTKSAPGVVMEKSKYFSESAIAEKQKDITKQTQQRQPKKEAVDDHKRVSHRDLISRSKTKLKNDVTADLVTIIKGRVKEAKIESKKNIVKGKINKESDEDSDYLPEEVNKRTNSDSEEDFKPTKISPKPSTSRKIDRRVLSSDDDTTQKNKVDVWCEVFVEELEQWIAVDIIKGKVHCTENIYSRATHPMCYVVGWDNNNYLKDLTRRYVPHWNTVTRKQRAEPSWWDTAVRPWLAPKTARDREEDEQLNRMQLEAPLPKTISEYKNHPLYALKRHLLKFEAIYPPDAATLGFVRNEPVYGRECVYVCRSRDTWLKEAKVVRLGEKPYKVVKARPKWDRLSNKLITDKPLEVFGPWQVQDYEPPVAENGIVPRNAYGNVELFKDCMLPKGTVHIKLPNLNRVAKKLNIDCAPAMTGFDFNGGWSHPVYDGFVVCKEFEEIVTEAWVKDQEDQERKELEKIETRVYGNWRRLIKGLMIRERLKDKYGFEKPNTTQDKKKAPRLVVKKRT